MSAEGLLAASECREGDICPVCKVSVIVLCDCCQGEPLEHLICLDCGEDVEECDCI